MDPDHARPRPLLSAPAPSSLSPRQPRPPDPEVLCVRPSGCSPRLPSSPSSCHGFGSVSVSASPPIPAGSRPQAASGSRLHVSRPEFRLLAPSRCRPGTVSSPHGCSRAPNTALYVRCMPPHARDCSIEASNPLLPEAPSRPQLGPWLPAAALGLRLPATGSSGSRLCPEASALLQTQRQHLGFRSSPGGSRFHAPGSTSLSAKLTTFPLSLSPPLSLSLCLSAGPSERPSSSPIPISLSPSLTTFSPSLLHSSSHPSSRCRGG